MLEQASEIQGCTVGANNSQLGTIKDFLFDDAWWIVRYAVADTGNWLRARQVLLSTTVLHEPNSASSCLPVELTKQQYRAPPRSELKPRPTAGP